jgi:hypothetical protein
MMFVLISFSGLSSVPSSKMWRRNGMARVPGTDTEVSNHSSTRSVIVVVVAVRMVPLTDHALLIAKGRR